MKTHTIIALILILTVPLGAMAASLTQTLAPNDTLTIAAQSCDLSVTAQSKTGVSVACGPQWTPTPLPAGVPACTDHDVTKWHGLVKRGANNAILCTYGHTHFDNPHDLDAALGPLPVPEISYPWMTSNENVEAGKHRMYKWTVIDTGSTCTHPNANYGIRRMRLESHRDANAGALGRFHSFWLQAELCDPNDASYRGFAQFGGHMDTHRLYGYNGSTDDYIATPGDDTQGQGRIHGTVAVARNDFTWYGQTVYGNIGIREEDWGPVDPFNLSRQLFYGGAANHSWMEPAHLVQIDTPYDGTTWSGFTDRSNHRVPDGCVIGPDCIPVSFQNVQNGGHYQFRADGAGLQVRDFDVLDPVTGQSLITFPN